MAAVSHCHYEDRFRVTATYVTPISDILVMYDIGYNLKVSEQR
jgi:hypothetical protein